MPVRTVKFNSSGDIVNVVNQQIHIHMSMSLKHHFQVVIVLYGQNKFSFVYLPDLHLRPDSATEVDFKVIQKQIKKLNPDFILTGGDMVYTAKNINEKKAEVLFDYMDEKLGEFKMPVHFTMGNHETVGITKESGIDSSNPMWG